MSVYQALLQIVHESGLWTNGSLRQHGFVLSPSVFELTRAQADEFEALAPALHDCLSGFGRMVAVASQPGLVHGQTWGMIKRVAGTGVLPTYQAIQNLKPGRVPEVCKVDFMMSQDSRLIICEIDGHNKHGMGYSTLGARMRRVLQNGHGNFPGVAAMLAEAIRARGGNKATLLYGDQERFYLPEVIILRDELATLDICLTVVSELDVLQDLDQLHGPEGILPDLFVDFPFLFRKPELNQALEDLYKAQAIDFLIPPKPFLGSKAVLALLRNDVGDEGLEAILLSFIPKASLELLRGYIPKTFLVSKQRGLAEWQALCADGSFVLKESISSGMKGTLFQEDDRFPEALRLAARSQYRAILQEEVKNKPLRFDYFTPEGEQQSADWFTRITVHFCRRRVADVIVTARQDKSVHGATDCLQLGAVIAS